MIGKKHFLLLLYGICYLTISSSQQPVFKQYTVSDGLPNSTIFRLHQQKEGLLWIGTDNGICSFDGKNFRRYGFNPSSDLNSILSIADFSPDTLLYYVYKKGYYLLHQQKVQFFHKEVEECRNVVFMKRDLDGRIWLINSTGRIGYFQNNQFHKFKLTSKELKVNCMALIGETLLFGTNEGIYRMERNTMRGTYDDVIGKEDVISMTFAPNNQLWVGTNQQTYELSVQQGQLQLEDELAFAPAKKVIADSGGNIWLWEMHGGLYLQHHFLNQTKPIELIHDLVNDIAVDHEGNIWAGTYGKGLYCYTSQNTFNQIEVLQSRVLYETNKGDIVIGAMGQLLIIEKENLLNFRKIPLETGKLTSHIFQDSEQNIMVCNYDKVFQVKDTTAHLFQWKEKGMYASVKNPARPGQLFLGSKGLMELNETIETYRYNNGFEGVVFALSYDQNGVLWIGTDKGVVKMERDSVFTYIPDNIKGRAKVYDILADHQGIVWAATTGGLLKCNHQGCELVSLDHDKTDFFPCKALAVDKDKHLWVGTPMGVFKESNGQFKLLELPFQESLGDIYDLLIDRNNGLWVATENRVVSLNIDSLPVCTSPLEVNLETILLGNQQLSSVYNNEIDYDPDFRNLEVYFSVVAFNRANQVVSHYRLAGHDPSWQQTSERKIIYHALQPGTYQFQLKTKLKNQEHFSAVQSFSFTLHPPFYDTPWFKWSAVLTVLLVLVLVLHKRNQSVRKKKREQLAVSMRLNELKHSALNAMMNPHFVDNVLQSIQYFVRTKSKIESGRFIGQFSKLIRNSLESAGQNKVSLYDELVRLKLFLDLEKARLENKFDYSVHVPDELDTEQLKVPNLIIQPFVENAIWHGILPGKQHGEINVSISFVNESQLMITIEDNGIGFHHSKQRSAHNSLGIELVREKLKLNHPDNHLEIEEITNGDKINGTMVTIRVHVD